MIRSLALVAALVLLLLLSLALTATPQSGAQQPPLTPELHILASGPDGLSLEITVPEPQVARRSPGTAAPESFLLDGYAAGPEGLPVRELLVGLPPSGAVSLKVEPLAPARTLPGPAPAIPEPSPDEDPTNLPLQTEWEWQPLPERPRNLPLASLTEEGFFREWRVARLRLAPMAYLGGGQWSLTQSFRVQLAFDSTPSRDGTAPADPVAAPLSSVVEKALVNGQQALAWRSPSAPVLPTTVYTLPQVSWRIPITSDGFYRLRYKHLKDAEFPITGAKPSDLHLLWRGQEVAMQGIGMDDGSFDAGDVFVFYGQKFHGSVQDEKYTDENIYWLVLDDTTPGLRMESRSVAPIGPAQPVTWYTDTVRIGENIVYWGRGSDYPVTDATWFWDRLVSKNTVLRHYPITFTNLAPDPYTGTLHVEIASRSRDVANPDHHVELGLNGTVVGEDYWDDRIGRVIVLPFSSTLLLEGGNNVDLAMVNDVGRQEIFVDFAQVTYRRQTVAQEDRIDLTAPFGGAAAYTITGFTNGSLTLYDRSDPLRPVVLTDADVSDNGATWDLVFQDSGTAGKAYTAQAYDKIAEIPALTRYEAALDLLSEDAGADEILITPEAFYEATRQLAERRRAEGLRVEVVRAEDIYALFNGGIFHPRAIRDFLAYAYDRWQPPAPAYALLVGDGHFNFKGYAPESYGPPTPVFIPPYLAFIDPWQGEVPVDTLFAQIVGADTFPDLALGRLPANSPQDVQDYLAKITGYEAMPPDALLDRIIHTADNIPDSAGDFERTLDDLQREFVPARMQVEKVYLTDFCGSPIYPPTPCPSATLALTQTWSQGAAMVSFAGHGSVNFWAHEGLLRNTQIDSLQPGHYLPFVMTLNCLDGYWMLPPEYPGLRDPTSIAEWMVMADDYGSIASFSPAGLGTNPAEEVIAHEVYGAIFDDGLRRFGDIALVGQLTVVAFPPHLAQVTTLFGDPVGSLRIKTPITEMDLDPDTQAQSGLIGNPVVHHFTLTNKGNYDDVGELAVSGNSWPAYLSVTRTQSLTPDASVSVWVTVSVPVTASHGDTDSASLVVTPLSDSNAQDSATLVTTATSTHWRLYLPLVRRNHEAPQ